MHTFSFFNKVSCCVKEITIGCWRKWTLSLIFSLDPPPLMDQPLKSAIDRSWPTWSSTSWKLNPQCISVVVVTISLVDSVWCISVITWENSLSWLLFKQRCTTHTSQVLLLYKIVQVTEVILPVLTYIWYVFLANVNKKTYLTKV